MKYNLTQDLISCETTATFQNPGNPTTEFYPPAIFIETCQTLDENGNAAYEKNDIQQIKSRKYQPYLLFNRSWNTLNAKLVAANEFEISAQINQDTININERLDSSNVKVSDIDCFNIGNKAKFTTLSDTQTIYVQNTITTNNKANITNITGTYITNVKNKHSKAYIQDISADNLKVTGTAQLTAMATYWADIAELYEADNKYDYGTLVCFSGKNEIEIATSYANGCISKDPAVLLNSAIRTKVNSQPIVLIGKTKVKVFGEINKFDRIELSSIPGIATKHTNKNIIGIALETNYTKEIKLVDCIVKLTF